MSQDRTKISIADERKAAAWLWHHNREQLIIFALDCAKKAVRNGAQNIDGFSITEEKVI